MSPFMADGDPFGVSEPLAKSSDTFACMCVILSSGSDQTCMASL